MGNIDKKAAQKMLDKLKAREAASDENDEAEVAEEFNPSIKRDFETGGKEVITEEDPEDEDEDEDGEDITDGLADLDDLDGGKKKAKKKDDDTDDTDELDDELGDLADLDEPSDEESDEMKDEVEDDMKDDEEEDAETASTERDAYENALAEFINAFNHTNEQTPFSLIKYRPTEEHYKSFKVSFQIDDTMIYFDNAPYEDGEVKLKFNDIFFSKLDVLAKDAGIFRIEWQSNEDGDFGVITI